MLENFKEDIQIVLDKMNGSEIKDVHEYRTLANSLKGIIQIVKRKTVSREDLDFLGEVMSSVDQEIDKLTEIKTIYLNDGKYQLYNKLVDAFTDISYSKEHVGYMIHSILRRRTLPQYKKQSE